MRSLPKALRTRITEYFRYVWLTRKEKVEEQEILAELPWALRIQLLSFVNRHVHKAVRILDGQVAPRPIHGCAHVYTHAYTCLYKLLSTGCRDANVHS